MSEAERFERAFKRKARATYYSAMMLLASDPNGAANRAYYCLYQALIAELEYRGVRPEQIDAGSAQAAKSDLSLKWTHSFIKRNASLAGLDARECSIVVRAYQLRAMADYSDEDVGVELVAELLKRIAGILECLGVNLGK